MSDEKVESSSLAWYGVVWEFGVMTFLLVYFSFLYPLENASAGLVVRTERMDESMVYVHDE